VQAQGLGAVHHAQVEFPLPLELRQALTPEAVCVDLTLRESESEDAAILPVMRFVSYSIDPIPYDAGPRSDRYTPPSPWPCVDMRNPPEDKLVSRSLNDAADAVETHRQGSAHRHTPK
jgi:hypothetical protein